MAIASACVPPPRRAYSRAHGQRIHDRRCRPRPRRTDRGERRRRRAHPASAARNGQGAQRCAAAADVRARGIRRPRGRSGHPRGGHRSGRSQRWRCWLVHDDRVDHVVDGVAAADGGGRGDLRRRDLDHRRGVRPERQGDGNDGRRRRRVLGQRVDGRGGVAPSTADGCSAARCATTARSACAGSRSRRSRSTTPGTPPGCAGRARSTTR